MRGAASTTLTRTSVLLALALSTACSAPSPDRRRTVWQSTQRVLAIDFGDGAMARRTQRLAKVPTALAREGHRAAGLAGSLAGAVPDEVPRLTAATSRAETWWASEWRRQPHLPRAVLPTSHAFGQGVADDLDHLGSLLVGRRPLPEIDDRVHRTDPNDVHPEATWWQRLQRRLWL